MRAKKVFESISFERGQDPYDALQIGHFGIKRALLSQGQPKVDSMEGDSMREWLQGLPEELHEVLDYDPYDPLAFTDYYGFDEDWYIENELPEEVDPEEFQADFSPEGSKKTLQRNLSQHRTSVTYQIGRLPDGSKVVHYIDGMGSGYIAHKDWLKKNK